MIRFMVLLLVFLATATAQAQKIIRLPEGSPVQNTGSDVALFSYTFPAGYQSLGIGECVDLRFAIQRTTGSSSITYKIRFGAAVVTLGADSNNSIRTVDASICNRTTQPHTQEWFYSILGTTVSGVALSTEDSSDVGLALEVLSNGPANTAVTPRFFRGIIWPNSGIQ